MFHRYIQVVHNDYCNVHNIHISTTMQTKISTIICNHHHQYNNFQHLKYIKTHKSINI